MFQRLVITALLAGMIAGLALTVVQHFTTIPLILAAEKFESPAKSGSAASSGQHGHGHDAITAPLGGLERLLQTLLANVVTGAGFAFILAGCFALWGRPVDGVSGMLWGISGFAIFTLGPGLGLPPELPGMAAAEVEVRQVWWAAAAGSTAAGLWLLVFRREYWVKAAAIAVMALPHLVGAPHADATSALVPPELASRFAAASLVTSAIFWCVLGWVAGACHRRLVEREADSGAATRV
ncbi:MAG: CbtA family protein [Alphaproteobacteria bacterium]|nr:CbtA family protein [Alphaproteobacteria bacterium]